MPIFSRNGQLLIFWPKFGEIAQLRNYVQYVGSIIVEGVAESWVETEISWMEVDGAGWRWVHGLAIPKAFSVNKQKHRTRTPETAETKG